MGIIDNARMINYGASLGFKALREFYQSDTEAFDTRFCNGCQKEVKTYFDGDYHICTVCQQPVLTEDERLYLWEQEQRQKDV